MKECRLCKIEKPLTEFSPNIVKVKWKTYHYYRKDCKICYCNYIKLNTFKNEMDERI